LLSASIHGRLTAKASWSTSPASRTIRLHSLPTARRVNAGPARRAISRGSAARRSLAAKPADAPPRAPSAVMCCRKPRRLADLSITDLLHLVTDCDGMSAPALKELRTHRGCITCSNLCGPAPTRSMEWPRMPDVVRIQFVSFRHRDLKTFLLLPARTC